MGSRLNQLNKAIDSEWQVASKKLTNRIKEKNKDLEQMRADLKNPKKKPAQALHLVNKIKKAAGNKMHNIN